MEDSFLTQESVDGGKISIWKDVSHKTILAQSRSNKASGINLTQGNSSRQPIFAKHAFNDSIPSVKFSSINPISGDFLYNGNFGINTNKITFFLVTRRNAVGWEVRSLSGVRNGVAQDFSSANSFWIYEPSNNGENIRSTLRGVGNLMPHPGNGTTYILSLVYDGSAIRTYINGTLVVENSASGSIIVDKMYIGKGSHCQSPTIYGGSGFAQCSYQGEISEMIFFDKNLKNDDRKSVEKYLGDKYAIKIADD